MKVLLDTNFILSCVKQKIDFETLSGEIFDTEIEWIVPEEVLIELVKLSKRKGEKVKDKNAAQTSLNILENMSITKISLKTEHVDDGIVNYLSKNKCILATLDKELKTRVNSDILTIKGRKIIGFVANV